MSVATIVAFSIRALPSSTVTLAVLPSSIVSWPAAMTLVEIRLPFVTWYVSTAVRVGTSSAWTSAGPLARPKARAAASKASLVGANTVEFGRPLKVSARPALTSADTRVLNAGLPLAICAIVGSEDRPRGVRSAAAEAATEGATGDGADEEQATVPRAA